MGMQEQVSQRKSQDRPGFLSVTDSYLLCLCKADTLASGEEEVDKPGNTIMKIGPVDLWLWLSH